MKRNKAMFLLVLVLVLCNWQQLFASSTPKSEEKEKVISNVAKQEEHLEKLEDYENNQAFLEFVDRKLSEFNATLLEEKNALLDKLKSGIERYSVEEKLQNFVWKLNRDELFGMIKGQMQSKYVDIGARQNMEYVVFKFEIYLLGIYQQQKEMKVKYEKDLKEGKVYSDKGHLGGKLSGPRFPVDRLQSVKPERLNARDPRNYKLQRELIGKFKKEMEAKQKENKK